MSENCTHDCSTCGEECASRARPDAFWKNQRSKPCETGRRCGQRKGRRGKSLVTSLLATELRRREKKVAVLDADITFGDASKLVKQNTAYYMPVFQYMKRTGKNKFNFFCFSLLRGLDAVS